MAKITDTTSDNNMKQEKHSAGKEMLGTEEDNFGFESVSCFVLSKHSKPRKWTVQVLKWPYPLKISLSMLLNVEHWYELHPCASSTQVS